ncbi:MAG TPA: flavin reductase family protein [Nocardioidaceae bacterium]|nr:flavin reductase family protein [Nocardioidaceae bacterium]
MNVPRPDDFRGAMSRFASGVTVACAVLDDVDHAMTASAFTSVSLDPPLVLVCVDKSARFHQAIALTRTWAVSVLACSQAQAAKWLALRGRPLPGQLDGVPHRRGVHSGAALLDGALCWLECRTWEIYDGGDHSIVVGQVLGLELGSDEDPLVYFRGEMPARFGGGPGTSLQ